MIDSGLIDGFKVTGLRCSAALKIEPPNWLNFKCCLTVSSGSDVSRNTGRVAGYLTVLHSRGFHDCCEGGPCPMTGYTSRSAAQQRHIVHVLAVPPPPDHSMSVSVEFFRSHHIPHLSVHLHQGAVRSWHVDYASPPPHIRETSPRNKNPTSVAFLGR